MRRLELIVVAVAIGAGCTCGGRKEHADAASGDSAAGMRVGSTTYFLEMGALHERYGDPAGALGHFAHALDSAKTPEQRIQAQLGLARANEALRDTGAAINHLEAAEAELEGIRGSGSGAGPLAAVSAPGGEIVPWLGRLYVAAGRLSDAERLYERALAQARDLPQGDAIRRLQIDLWTNMGSLPQRIAEKENALGAKDPDEGDLRFLALACSGGGAGIGLVSPGWADGGPKGAELEKLVRVYERLYEIHKTDDQLRQALISLYERQGKVDQAIRLLREPNAGQSGKTALHDGAPSLEQVSCQMGSVPRPMPAALATGAEVVRTLIRAGRAEQALTETRKLVALGPEKSVGVQAFTVGARLYLEQNRPEMSAQALAEGARAGRSPADRRELAMMQADLLLEMSKLKELKELLDRWKRSDDACLRAEATRREPLVAQAKTQPSVSGVR